MKTTRNGKKVGETNDRCRSEHLSGSEAPQSKEFSLLSASLASFLAGSARLGIQPEHFVKMAADMVGAIEETSKQLNLSDEERQDGINTVATEAVSRMPQIAKALFITASLPTLSAHAFRYFHFNRGKTVHDAEDLSQKFTLKVLSAFWGPWPRKNKNVGAWLAKIAANAHVDEIRKDSREKIAIERLKRAAESIRR